MVGDILHSPKTFPLIIATLSFLASIIYFVTGDWRRGCYWLFAGGIAVVVTV